MDELIKYFSNLAPYITSVFVLYRSLANKINSLENSFEKRNSSYEVLHLAHNDNKNKIENLTGMFNELKSNCKECKNNTWKQ